MASYNVPNINLDRDDDGKMPNDREEVEDEGTAPPVKSGYKPNAGKVAVKSGFPKKQYVKNTYDPNMGGNKGYDD